MSRTTNKGAVKTTLPDVIDSPASVTAAQRSREARPLGNGRGAGGANVLYWAEHFIGLSEDEVQAVSDDVTQPLGKRMAARFILRCLTDATSASGHFLAHSALEAFFDRTIGKPSQQVEVQHTTRTEHVLELTDDAIAHLKRVAAGKPSKSSG